MSLHHSTETALLRLLSEIYTAIDKSHPTILAIFDASSASDIADHDILLQNLQLSYGLSGPLCIALPKSNWLLQVARSIYLSMKFI